MLSGCSYIATKAGYEKKQATELKIEQIKQEKIIELDKKTKEIEKAHESLILQIKKNFQETANWLYGSFVASELVQNPDRLDKIIALRIKTAMAFAPAPTPEAILEQNRLLKEELDEVKISNEELKVRYNEKEKEAKLAKQAEREREADIQRIKDEKIKIEQEYNIKIVSAQNELNKINDQIIASERKNTENKQKEEKLQRLIIYFLMGGAALFGAAAALTRGRTIEFAIGAICCVGLACAVPFIEKWMVIAGIISLFIIIIGIIYYKMYQEKKIADSSVGAIQELRNEDENLYIKKIKPKLEEWHGESKSTKKRLHNKLKDLNLI